MPDRRERIKDLKDQRRRAHEHAREILERVAANGDVWTSEDDEAWAKCDGTIESLSKTIDAEEREYQASLIDARTVEDADEELRERTNGQVGYEQYNDVFDRYVRGGREALSSEDRAVLAARYVPNIEGRVQQTLTGSAGGYGVPAEFWARIQETLKLYTSIEGLANVITTDNGADLPWPGNDDTANEGAILAEGTQVSDQDVALTSKTLSAYVYTSKQVKVSLQLLQDSFFDWEGFLARKFAQRLGRIHNRHFTVGTGSSQPDGVITSGTTKSAAGASAITYNDIINLVHDVDPAYRASGNARFMFSDLILAELRKIRDDSGGSGLGRPIWEPSVQVGEPNTLLGFGYSINQNMDTTIASTKKTVAFGDFNAGYVIRRVRGMSMVRFDEKYMDYLQIGFLAFDRVDGTADDTAAYRVLVH